MKPLLIIGGSSFGQLMAVLAVDCGRVVAGFVDDIQTGPEIVGRTGDLGHALAPADYELVLAIGYKHLEPRMALFRQLGAAGFSFPPLVHPTARISSQATVGAGCLIMARADVDAFTRIGDACVLWPNATISHDNSIGDNTFISPSATLCGFVSVDSGVFIGANCTVVDGSKIESGAFIKASTRYQTKAPSTP